MSFFFLWIALALAVLDWVAVARQSKRLEYFTKPGVMVALLAWLWQTSGFNGSLIWFGLGLLFSLAGDIFLMLPREQFIAGLVSFLLAHLTYIIGFFAAPPPANAASLILALLVGLVARQLYVRISSGLEASGHAKLKAPVLIYSAAISLMLISALVTLASADDPSTPLREGWQAAPALLVSAGAIFFFLSDSLLAWNKFVSPLSLGKLRVRVTYHLGQALIVVGAALHFLS